METNLIECPCCGSDACSKTTAKDGSDIYLCWTCGMTTNSLMEDGSDFEKDNYEERRQSVLLGIYKNRKLTISVSKI